MERITIEKKIKEPKVKEVYKSVAIPAETYDKVRAIAEESNTPILRVVSRLLEAAISMVEVV